MTAMDSYRDILVNNVRAVAARALGRIIGMSREPSWFLFDIFLPLLYVAAYVYVCKSLNAAPAYLGYVILGGAMMGIWMNVLWGMASQLYWEKERGQLELVLITPISTMSILLGMAVGGIYNTGIRALITFMLGIWVFRVPLAVSSWGLLILAFLLTLCALYGLGMIGSSVFLLCGRNAMHIVNLLQEPVQLVTGFYFPVRALGFCVALFASLIPMTLGLDAMRQILFGTVANAFLPVTAELIILTVLSFLFFFIAHKALRYVGDRARREGRLTLRWQ